MNDVTSILIGGKAGEGVKKAAQVLSAELTRLYYSVFQQDDYPSLIKGGHNFSIVSFAPTPVYTAHQQIQLLISLDRRSYELHHRDMADDETSVHFFNAEDTRPTASDIPGLQIGIPFTSLLKKHNLTPNSLSVAATALAYCWLGWDDHLLGETIVNSYKRDAAIQADFARSIWNMVKEQGVFARGAVCLKPAAYLAPSLLSGNQAISLGAWAGGLDFYYAYPMTPASSILHYLAGLQTSHRVYAIHAESELAAANMAIGSAISGARTAVGSSGGGFALMQEAFSLAGMAEVPLLFILSSRPGPATGVSTYTAQEDLFFALHQGHGEFGRIVAAPNDHACAFRLAAELLDLAWEFQSPVVLLSDKHISESSANISLPLDKITPMETKANDTDTPYQRYQITQAGVSPLQAFDNGDSMIKWSSHEHLPSGIRTDQISSIKQMKEKRHRKELAMYEATKRCLRVEIFGDKGTPVFCYGSSVMELREAQKTCKVPFRIISLIYLHPFPYEELRQFQGTSALVMEHSISGNLVQYMKMHLNMDIRYSINRYDGRPFDPLELAAILEEALHA